MATQERITGTTIDNDIEIMRVSRGIEKIQTLGRINIWATGALIITLISLILANITLGGSEIEIETSSLDATAPMTETAMTAHTATTDDHSWAMTTTATATTTTDWKDRWNTVATVRTGDDNTWFGTTDEDGMMSTAWLTTMTTRKTGGTEWWADDARTLSTVDGSEMWTTGWVTG